MSSEDTGLELNEPACIPGTAYSGPRQAITKAESRQRVVIMERLLASGKTDTAIEAVMDKEFQMDGAAVKRCRETVYQKWAAEAADRAPHLKTAARHRLYEALEGAKRDRSWAAVANLEKVLSGIEGTTVDPKEAATPTDMRLKESLVHMLNESDPNWIVEVIERERSISIKGTSKSEQSLTVNVTKDGACLPSPK